MNEPGNIQATAGQLMALHIDVLFTYDQHQRLRTINEPWPGERPAPRFFLGRTVTGASSCRFRYDVPAALAAQLQELAAGEFSGKEMKPANFDAYMRLLQAQRFEMGPAYLVPAGVHPAIPVVQLTRENVAGLAQHEFEWLVKEIDYVQPCMAVVHEGRAVSVCRSVRITSLAHEAGLETLPAFRGRGYAAEAVAAWAAAVRQIHCTPLYSTEWNNLASRRVAAKAGLQLYGLTFAVS